MKIDGTYDEEADKINKATISNEDRVKRMVDDYEVTRIKELKSKIEMYRVRINAMEIDVEDLGDFKSAADEIDTQDLAEDLKEKAKMEKEIAEMEAAVQTLKLNYEEKLRKHVAEEKSKLNSAIEVEKVHGSEQLIETSMCKTEFIQIMMNMVDSVMSWQLPLNEDCVYIPQFTPEFISIYDKLFLTICESVLHANRVSFMRQAENWIVCTRIQHCERAMYRQFHATGAKFNHLQVCQSVRDPDAVKLKNFQVQSLDVMLSNTNHPFHTDVLNYATWWTIGQLLNNVDVDNSLFSWDYEIELLSLARPQKWIYETIVRIGGEYALQLRGGWTYNNMGDLNVYWGTTNLLHAVTFWVQRRIADKKWKLYDRAKKSKVNIKQTALVDKINELFPPTQN